jgi:MFS family permease
VAAEPSLWSVGPNVYLPSVLFGIGQGAVLPVIALSARDLDASVAVAGLVVAVLGIGKVVGDLPAGVLADRAGERVAMMIGIGVALGALALCIVAPSVAVLTIGVLALGLSQSIWGLARHAYLTEVMPYRLRARALSTLGGTQRIGLFVGPFLAAAAMGPLGTPGAYWVHAGAAVAAGLVLVMKPDPQFGDQPNGPVAADDRVGMAQVVRRHSTVLRTLAMGSLLISAVRAGRQVAVPLWAEHIGLDPATTSIVFGLSGAAEMLAFYPAGLIMDRFGRQWAVLPSLAGLTITYALLPLTGDVVALAIVSAAMGLANGVGSGINMTVGADVSPATGRSTFLGVWRLCGDVGNASGPVLVAVVGGLTTLTAAVLSVGVVAAVAGIAMARWLPRHGRRSMT